MPQVATVTRGLNEEEGGFHWSGELRLWENEILMVWYAANDGSVRSKATMYLVLHPHGLNMSGRWIGARFRRTDHDWVSLDEPDPRGIGEKAIAALIERRGRVRQ